MDLLRAGICVGLTFGLASCGKKSDPTTAELEEAGYQMTAEGWYSAIAANDVGVMRAMIKGGFDEKTLDAEGNGALHAAVAAGNEEAAEYLLNRGFSVDEAGAGGKTPLMVAVLEDKPEMVNWLLRQGADPAVKDEEGFIPLMLAVTNGRNKAVEELAPFNREDLDSALLLASLVGQAEVIDTLTNYGASVYSRMDDGRTPLMLAAENGHTKAVALLMDIGASRFATTDDGSTAQSIAVSAGHDDIAEMIATGFTADVLALESDEEVVEAMDDYLAEIDPFEGEPAGEGDPVAMNEQDGTATGAEGIPGEEGGVALGAAGAPAEGDPAAAAGDEGAVAMNDGGENPSAAGNVAAAQGARQPVRSLDGAMISNPGVAKKADPPKEMSGQGAGTVGAARTQGNSEARRSGVEPIESTVLAEASAQEPPLVMRVYRQRELPLEVKQVSGGVATLNLAGDQPQQVQVAAGDQIPGSNLKVVRVFNRMEQGKLNDSQPMEVGIVEVEDTGNGQKREWIAGRSASAHDPVALVEDAVTGKRYVAQPGQKFRSENGREFVVNDVRPSQLVIEDTTTGEVRTLRLAGPKG